MRDYLKDPKLRRVAMASAAGLIVLVIAAWALFQDQAYLASITPPDRFADEKASPAPDYSRAEAWAAKPSLPPPGGWEQPWGVDIFYVHPTSAYGGAWNVAINDKTSSERLSRSVLPNHGGPFEQAGPFYAPRYRQASLYAELNAGGQGDGAFLVAYNDVLAAFDYYRTHFNRERGIILAGDGQGGLYVQKLIADRFQSEPMKSRLIAAYVIDAAVPSDFPGKTVAQPICTSHSDIHCIVAWKAVTSGEEARRFRETSPVWTTDWKIAAAQGKPLVCVNPISWMTGEELATRGDHRGAAHVSGPDAEPKIIPNVVNARCRDGVLNVEKPSDPSLQTHGWGARYQTPDFNLFYADITANVVDRANVGSVWLDANAQKPAEPLPPVLTLTDSPVARPNGVAEPVQ
ncbi:MAG TPA: DUF3089 domain-containing protein [Hyphomonadaceae bacterium]|nr:DUF3089 domain-containing protein [Hyphomonadaceae bacterium]